MFQMPIVCICTFCLLLAAGVDPDVADSDGDRPLIHYLARLNASLAIRSAACSLLEAGAYQDRRNNEEKTAADVWVESHRETRRRSMKGNQKATQKSDVPGWFRDDTVQYQHCSALVKELFVVTDYVPHSFGNIPLTSHRFLLIQ